MELEDTSSSPAQGRRPGLCSINSKPRSNYCRFHNNSINNHHRNSSNKHRLSRSNKHHHNKFQHKHKQVRKSHPIKRHQPSKVEHHNRPCHLE